MSPKIITAAIRIKNCVSDLHFWPYFLLYFSLAKNGGRNGAAEFILQRYFFYFGRLLFPLHFYSNSRLLIFHSLSRAINFPLPFIFHWGALILARDFSVYFLFYFLRFAAGGRKRAKERNNRGIYFYSNGALYF